MIYFEKNIFFSKYMNIFWKIYIFMIYFEKNIYCDIFWKKYMLYIFYSLPVLSWGININCQWNSHSTSA